MTAAVSIRPLVAIAQGTPRSLSHDSSSRAPGSGRICPRMPAVGGGMRVAQALDAILAQLDARLAEQLVGEEAAAHADLAMDAPHRQLDAFASRASFHASTC